MTAKKKGSRLAGHELPNEGRVNSALDPSIMRNGPGRSRCTCGERSPMLPNTAQRKQWHRDHKQDVLTAMGLNGKAPEGGKS